MCFMMRAGLQSVVERSALEWCMVEYSVLE